jgi:hypothetical protein
VATGTSDEAAAAAYSVEVLTIESTTPENSIAASRNSVIAFEMDDTDHALVGDSSAVLYRKGQTEVSEA